MDTKRQSTTVSMDPGDGAILRELAFQLGMSNSKCDGRGSVSALLRVIASRQRSDPHGTFVLLRQLVSPSQD